MGFDDAYQLGYIRKTHGLRGQVIGTFDVDDPGHYDNLESVFLNQNGTLVPFFIETINLQGKEAIMSLEGFSSKDEVAHLVGTELWLPTDLLPELPEGSFYYHDLIGYELLDGDLPIGIVAHIYPLPNNYLLGIKDHKSKKEILVPTQDPIVRAVDHEAKRILATLPDGLVDLYTTEE